MRRARSVVCLLPVSHDNRSTQVCNVTRQVAVLADVRGISCCAEITHTEMKI